MSRVPTGYSLASAVDRRCVYWLIPDANSQPEPTMTTRSSHASLVVVNRTYPPTTDLATSEKHVVARQTSPRATKRRRTCSRALATSQRVAIPPSSGILMPKTYYPICWAGGRLSICHRLDVQRSGNGVSALAFSARARTVRNCPDSPTSKPGGMNRSHRGSDEGSVTASSISPARAQNRVARRQA
jgi:hypothetical protein